MNLEIEKWIKQQDFDEPILDLFEESLKCYRTSAYKAALLFSYLGLTTILKNRLLRAKSPPGLKEEIWTKIKNDIRNEESWDFHVFEATQRKDPAPVFPISESLRREMVYWKDRRNDCAHSKNETISYHHVESFWAFLKRNLSKLVVNGGKNALFEKILDHFDYSRTPSGKDITPLVKEIEPSVEGNELPEFFKELTGALTSSAEVHNFFSRIFEVFTNRISQELTSYLKSDFLVLMNFLGRYPNHVSKLALSPSQVREIWYKELFIGFSNDLSIFIAFLRNDLIPVDDIREAMNKLVSGCTERPTEYEYQILRENGIDQIIYNNRFKSDYLGYYRDVNNQRKLIISYLEHNNLDRQIVNCICKSFERSYPPRHFGDDLLEFLSRNEEKKVEFRRIAEDHEISIPSPLASIF